MAKDGKEQARAGARRAQRAVESGEGQLSEARAARRKAFERARSSGLSLTEIAEAAGLHRSRVDQILHGK
jgi:DNA-directed RNA polymerase specialized sigma24 family protein